MKTKSICNMLYTANLLREARLYVKAHTRDRSDALSWSVFFFNLPFCISMFLQGLGAESKNLYPFLLPVIQLSTDVSQPPHVYLLEDGLELWYGHMHSTLIFELQKITPRGRHL